MSMFSFVSLFSPIKRHFNSVFELDIDPSTKSTSCLEFPPAFVSFTRLILFDSEWDRSKAKGKPPRPKAELMTLKVMKKVLEQRLEEYATTLDVSFPVLSSDDVHYTYFRSSNKYTGRRTHDHVLLVNFLGQQAQCTYPQGGRETDITYPSEEAWRTVG